MILTRLSDAGLKVNTKTCTFCTHEIEYLGYVLTRDGLKPQKKKVQAMLALELPKGARQLQTFLAMVQY